MGNGSIGGIPNAVKMLGMTDDHYRVGGYGVVYGGRDLDGETFTQDTDYQLGLVPQKPVYYDHAMRDIKSPLGSVVDVKADDTGLWVEAELQRNSEYVERVMALVHVGALGWSSGSINHLARREGGLIKSWPIVELSLTPTPAEPRTLGVQQVKSLLDLLPAEVAEALQEVAQDSDATASDEPGAASQPIEPVEGNKMSEEVKAVETTAAPQLDAVLEAVKALGAQFAQLKDEVKATDAKAVNDPGIAMPNVIMADGGWRYDNTDTADLAIMAGVLGAAKSDGRSRRGVSEPALKALVRRMDSEETQKQEWGRVAGMAVKSQGIKANEINQSTLASYGDEWVGVAYSGALWEKVRQATFVLNMLPQFEFPAGAESIVLPLEGTDPVWYKVAQAASLSANPGGIPTNTVTASNLGTGSQTMTLSKLGARVLWTGELEEDAILPYVAQLRNQLAVSGAEYLEAAIIDGDTDASASTNINAIDTTPTATDWYLVFNGFRKVPLVTLTANSRDGGALDVSDFLETIKLMGSGGISGADMSKVHFILDRFTHWKALELPEVKTRDVYSGATVEAGRLTNIWGYPVHMSGQVCKVGGGKSNTAGKVDADTAGNNTKGQIIAVRPDRWRFGWRRRMTIETTRVPAADSTEIVALMRAGLIYSATDDAAAITYNLSV